MCLDTFSNEIVVARRQRLQEPPAEQRRCAPGAERPPRCQQVSVADRVQLVRARQIVIAAKEAAGATLNWLADLPYDSRDRLHSKEHELAMLGVSWASDPVYDAALAREIEIARQRRRAASEVASGVAAEARPGLPSRAARRDRRISIAGREPDHADLAV